MSLLDIPALRELTREHRSSVVIDGFAVAGLEVVPEIHTNDDVWRITCIPLSRGQEQSSSTSNTASRRRQPYRSSDIQSARRSLLSGPMSALGDSDHGQPDQSGCPRMGELGQCSQKNMADAPLLPGLVSVSSYWHWTCYTSAASAENGRQHVLITDGIFLSCLNKTKGEGMARKARTTPMLRLWPQGHPTTRLRNLSRQRVLPATYSACALSTATWTLCSNPISMQYQKDLELAA